MLFPFPLAPIAKEQGFPIWENNHFIIDGKPHKVLRYSTNDAGWSDNLTSLHEENASDNHPVDLASRKHAIEQIRQFCKVKNPVILEVGCSSGYLLKDLQNTFPDAFLIGADVIPEKLELLAETLPNIPLMQFDLIQCPLPNSSIDVLIMLNVLEHIEDDKEALKQAKRILKPGGLLILEVPAGPHLYDIYDKFLHHFRRYTLSHLSATVTDIGFKVMRKSHLGVLVYPAFYRVKKNNQKLLQLPEKEQEKIVSQQIQKSGQSSLFKLIMKLEMLLGKFFNYSYGIRCLLTCKK